MKKLRFILVTIVLFGVIVYYVGHPMKQAYSQKATLGHLHNDTQNRSNSPAGAGEMHSDAAMEVSLGITPAAAPRAPEEELKELTDAEQQSLWVAFSQARREIRSIPASRAEREENLGFEFYALHPKQNLTTRFGAQGVQFVSSDRTYTEDDRNNPTTSWAAQMYILSLAGNATPRGTSPKKTDVSSTRVEYQHSTELTEWYDNGVTAMEHGYTVTQRPAHLNSSEDVVIEVALNGLSATAHTAEDGTYQLNFNQGDRTVLSYSKLLVLDAQGKELSATMQPTDAGFTLAYNDAQAAYPVTVDPLIVNEEAKLNRIDAAADDYFGRSVSISGDTVVVGANQDDDGGSDSGSAYVFIRSGTAWSQQAKLTAADAAEFDRFGTSVAISGNSVAVGAYTDDDGGSSSGSAYVFTRSGTVWSQQAKLTADDAEASDYFGVSVAISGDSAVVGAFQDDDGGSASGSAYIFTRSGTAWSQQAKLTAGDAAVSDSFGISVAISGDFVVVGARGDDDGGSASGSAYIFTRSGTAWSQQAKLIANDAAAGDYFGHSVSISGDFVVVGAYQDDDGGSSSGSAYVFIRGGTVWSQQAKLIANDAAVTDIFGYSVAISGDSVVVGAYGEDDGGLSSGSAYVFTRRGIAWSQQAKLTAGDTEAYDHFGYSVAISGDFVVAGASGKNYGGSSSGSAYVFIRSGTEWSQQAKLVDGDAEAGDYFGRSVAISGDSVVVCAPNDADGGLGSGSAYVFTRSGTEWSQQAKLTASDATEGDSFGTSVAISTDSIVVGAYGDDDGGSLSGSAYVFTRSSTAWSQQAKLTANDATASDLFGWSVSISGDSVVVGAYLDDDGGSASGSAYVFTRSGTTWSQQAKLTANDAEAGDNFGWSTSISGDFIAVGSNHGGDSGSHSGSAYVFSRSGTTWSLQVKLTADDAAEYDNFGYSVAISGDSIVVGAYLDDDGGSGSGSAYVFTRSGTAWSQQAKLTAGDAAEYDRFGASVAISGDSVAVGAYTDDDGGSASGSAYVFTRSGTTWSQQTKLTAGDAAAGDHFGVSVAISGDSVAVGADEDDDGGSLSGSIYIYRFAVSGERQLLVYDGFGTQILNGSFATTFTGQELDTSRTYTFRLNNAGELDLDLQSISLGGANLSEFSLTAPDISSSTDLSYSQSLDFTITFSPSGSSALRNATVLITSNDSSTPVFAFNISGLGLSNSTDGDGDGMNDWAEYSLRDLGFDWATTQHHKVSVLYSNASTAELYTQDEVQVIHVGSPMIQVTGGTATLTIGIEKSTDLSSFDSFPFTAPETSINEDGEIEFEFPVLDDSTFFLLDVR